MTKLKDPTSLIMKLFLKNIQEQNDKISLALVIDSPPYIEKRKRGRPSKERLNLESEHAKKYQAWREKWGLNRTATETIIRTNIRNKKLLQLKKENENENKRAS